MREDMARLSPLEGMFGGMGEGNKGLTPITGDEAAKYRESMKHIENLKPGDKVMWKGKEYAICKTPKVGKWIEVFRVGTPESIGSKGDTGSAYECQEKDFTSLYRDSDGDVVEYAYDSRRFERVE